MRRWMPALVGAVALALVALGAPAVADAAAKPSAGDKRAMVRANVACQEAPTETSFEDCVIGHFVMDTHRYVDERYYSTDFGRDAKHYVQLTRRSTRVPS